MNRRDLLKRLGAAGLVAATVDVPRFWSLDRTMVPTYWEDDFDIRYTAQVIPPPFTEEYVILNGRKYPVARLHDTWHMEAFSNRITFGVSND